ncbi:hypothetical protein DY000_02002606 [Brassica cretica]|uniref:Myb-like domain-containing protein n=1 Tax=Brassica cretica TaxID=69181 RepID=A0ABQ7CA02_BRACR|nr:hypothetical protein DY000_02002606 [Brassica cretica]
MLSDGGDSSLMKQVAAMACKVGPSVTTAAAKAAIAALCDEASCPKDTFETTCDFTDFAVDRADGDKGTSDMEEQQEDKEGPQDLPVALRMRASVATALGAAAAHAKVLADQEEREMEQLAAIIIDQQLKKMKSKLKFLDHLELIMDAEEQVMEGVKETILQERISVLQFAFGSGITKRWDHTLVTLCDKCFKNGDCGENNSAHDFKLIAAAAWTEEETLLLLESVLKLGDDWDLIAQSVSTKSRLDCISKLIELPFGEFLMGSSSGRLRSSIPTSEDENLSSPSNPLEQMKADGLEQKETKTREEKGEDHVVDEDEPSAKRKRVAMLSDGGGSSLMKQVAVMARKVGPSVATAAAEAAIAALCDEASCPKDIFETAGDSAVDRFDSQFAHELASHVLVKSNLKQILRALGDKDTSDMEEQQEDKEGTQDLPVALRMRASVATALGAAAAHAKILADQEEREMEQLAACIIDQQLKKMKSKLKFLDHLELIMDAEEQVMEGVKETILQERISVLQFAFGSGITKRWDHTYVK